MVLQKPPGEPIKPMGPRGMEMESSRCCRLLNGSLQALQKPSGKFIKRIELVGARGGRLGCNRLYMLRM